MAYRKFLTSVPDVYAYNDADNLVFIGKTLSNNSIEATLGSTPVRGGKVINYNIHTFILENLNSQ